jgi:hypothetical protein
MRAQRKDTPSEVLLWRKNVNLIRHVAKIEGKRKNPPRISLPVGYNSGVGWASVHPEDVERDCRFCVLPFSIAPGSLA